MALTGSVSVTAEPAHLCRKWTLLMGAPNATDNSRHEFTSLTDAITFAQTHNGPNTNIAIFKHTRRGELVVVHAYRCGIQSF